MTGRRISVWKHDCINHGTGNGPCDPPCPDPWMVEAQSGPQPADDDRTFYTWEGAIAYADQLAHREQR